MTGMLIGVAALSAWGLYRFNHILARQVGGNPSRTPACWSGCSLRETMYLNAFAVMYGDIFEVTVIICVVGALLGLLLGSRKRRASSRTNRKSPSSRPLANPAHAA